MIHVNDRYFQTYFLIIQYISQKFQYITFIYFSYEHFKLFQKLIF